MKSILQNVLYLFYPNLCVNCQQHLLQNETVLCTFCRHDIPLANFKDANNNKINKIFFGRVLIKKANTLLFYRKEGITQQLIHQLKYKGNQEIGILLGNWLGEKLKENNEFDAIDCIVPVPLHFKKLKQRGYNQVSKFGERLSFHLQKPFIENKLIRTSTSKTQTFKARFERFNNLDTKFQVKNLSFFNEKHVLLVDDVITTGATLEACSKALLKGNNITVSVLTMAYTE